MPVFTDIVQCKGLEVDGPVLIKMPYGRVIIGDQISKNGIRIISDVPGGDPAELVLESLNGGGLGKVSFARHRADGNREETVLWQGKIDESRPGSLSGETTLHLRDHTKPGDGMVLKDTRRSTDAPQGAIPGGHVTRFYTDGGKFFCNFQDDTGLPTGVLYNTTTGVAIGTIQINPILDVY